MVSLVGPRRVTAVVDRSVNRVGSVSVVRARSTVQNLHTIDPFQGDEGSVVAESVSAVSVLWCDFVGSTLILGSRQGDELVDRGAMDSAGISLARRRSGGGAVLAVPGSLIWVDLVIAAEAMYHDVRESMVWAGDLWRRALTGVGARGRLAVHRGPMMSDEWADRVCFAGLGPGEVLADGRKLVGLSQRRTRDGARISGALHVHSLLAQTVDLLARPLPVGRPAPIATAAVDPEQIAVALAAEVGAAARFRANSTTP